MTTRNISNASGLSTLKAYLGSFVTIEWIEFTTNYKANADIELKLVIFSKIGEMTWEIFHHI